MAAEAAIADIGKPLIFGEVLFDRFPDGTNVLGGAPFNVAWHLQGFGLNPLFVSCIGKDPAGREILDKMTAWGMDTRGIQYNDTHPTGTVQISLMANQPSFDICPEQAYDYIEQQPVAQLLTDENLSLLYHGSLAIRNETTRRTLQWLSATSNLPAFVDINLRPPWWTQDDIEWALRNAHWLKLNNDELDRIAGSPADSSLEERCHTLLDRFKLELLILTLGEDGALLVSHSRELHGKAEPVARIIDTVGAGDAFSSVTLLGLLHHWEPSRILDNALDFAAAICGIRGATLFDHVFYKDFVQRWEC